MESFVIEGGHALSGRIRAEGNKNGALPILAACLLTDEPVVLQNVPRILDVETMLALLEHLGAARGLAGGERGARPRRRRRDARGARGARQPDPGVVPARRAAPGPPGPRERAAARRRRHRPPAPRPAHPRVRRARCHRARSTARYELEGTLRGASLHLDEASVMATENALMAASLAPGRTTISNAACEPHVQDLCRFLVSLGAEIEGIGSNVLHVRGVDAARAAASTASRPTTSRSGASSAWPPSPAATSSIEDAAPEDHEADPARCSGGSASGSSSTAAPCTCRPGSGSRFRTTSAARSRRSRTAPGRRSRPT